MKMMRYEKREKTGFTLIELSLAIVFVSILSITMALMITDAVRSYRRGMVLNQVNTVGMDLVDDMRAVIQNSSSQPIANECAMIYGGNNSVIESCESDGGQKLVTFVYNADVVVNGTRRNVPISGGVCFGHYTYLWNSGYFFSGEVSDTSRNRLGLSYRLDGASARSAGEFRLLKVEDENREICGAVAGNGSYGNTGTTQFDLVLSEEPVELLGNDRENNSLAIYDLRVATPAENSAADALFYSVSFILGTIQGGMDITASGNFCSEPDGYDAILDYCAINKFNFAATAAGA